MSQPELRLLEHVNTTNVYWIKLINKVAIYCRPATVVKAKECREK